MKYVILLAALTLSACASTPSGPEFAVPTCSGWRECEAKWNAAEIWIKHNTGRRVVEKTDTMMRTDMSQSPGNYLSVLVEKVASGNNVHEIRATMYCAKRVGCDPSPWEATQRFNRYINNSWKVVDKDARPTGK